MRFAFIVKAVLPLAYCLSLLGCAEAPSDGDEEPGTDEGAVLGRENLERAPDLAVLAEYRELLRAPSGDAGLLRREVKGVSTLSVFIGDALFETAIPVQRLVSVEREPARRDLPPSIRVQFDDRIVSFDQSPAGLVVRGSDAPPVPSAAANRARLALEFTGRIRTYPFSNAVTYYRSARSEAIALHLGTEPAIFRLPFKLDGLSAPETADHAFIGRRPSGCDMLFFVDARSVQLSFRSIDCEARRRLDD